MDDQTDFSFDIDGLFKHLVEKLSMDLSDPQEWVFTLRAPSTAILESIANDLEDDFDLSIQEEVDEDTSEGGVTSGMPMLSVHCVDTLTAEEVKEIAARMEEIASTSDGVSYEGVSCYEPMDEDEIFGWLELDEATWRLRHFSDLGLEQDGEVPWAFLVAATSLDVLHATDNAVGQAGFENRRRFEDADEEGNFAMCIFVDGRNNEPGLIAMHEKLSALVQPFGGELVGVQFFSAEAFDEDETEE